MRFKNEHCNVDLHGNNNYFGWAKITYDREKYIQDNGVESTEGSIVSELNEHNQVDIDLDTYRSFFVNGSFECWTCWAKNGIVVVDEDYILNIEKIVD